LKNLPNIISLLRLFSAPIIVWLVIKDLYFYSFLFFVFAAISDAVDGFIARAFQARSEMGNYIDPLADKVLLVAIYLSLGYRGFLDEWIVILVVFRDLLIVGGVMVNHVFTNKDLLLDPLKVSKVNTLFQILLIAVALAELSFSLPALGLVKNYLIFLVAVTTAISGAGYLLRWFRVLV